MELISIKTMDIPTYSNKELNEIKYDFEDFLTDREKFLHEGLDPIFYKHVKVIQNPLKNITNLFASIEKLPKNILFNQSSKSLYQISLLLFILILPFYTLSLLFGIKFETLSIPITYTILITIGIAFIPLYHKQVYKQLVELYENQSANWLTESSKASFEAIYDSKWNMKLFLGSLLLTLIPISQFIITIIIESEKISTFELIFYIVLMGLGYMGIVFNLYISIYTFIIVSRNTKIYDTILKTIIKRVRGFTHGEESILSKKNYEVIRVLSDTPGLSIRTLSSIPQFGLGAAIIGTNAIIFLLIGPFLLSGFLIDGLKKLPQIGGPSDVNNLTIVILIGLFLSAVASFGAVISPLFRILLAMRAFKSKALKELDPYLFDELTLQATKDEVIISENTHLLTMIRNYIYTMKVTPVSPLRLIYLVAISLVYGFRGIPSIIGLFS